MGDAFKALDKNHDGSISKHELLSLVTSMSGGGRMPEEEINNIVEMLDLEANDNMTFEEFTHLVREEGGRRKRWVMGNARNAFKSCGKVFKATAKVCKVCHSTM